MRYRLNSRTIPAILLVWTLMLLACPETCEAALQDGKTPVEESLFKKYQGIDPGYVDALARLLPGLEFRPPESWMPYLNKRQAQTRKPGLITAQDSEFLSANSLALAFRFPQGHGRNLAAFLKSADPSGALAGSLERLLEARGPGPGKAAQKALAKAPGAAPSLAAAAGGKTKDPYPIWGGELGASLAILGGNTEKQTWDIDAKVKTEWTPRLTTEGKFRILRTKSDGELTHERYFAGLDTDFKISDLTFVRGNTSWEREPLVGLENRLTLGAKIGRTLWKAKNWWDYELKGLVGADIIRESLTTGASLLYPAATFAIEQSLKPFDPLSLGHKLAISFPLSGSEEASRTTTNELFADYKLASLAEFLPLIKEASVRFSHEWRNRSNPVPGKEPSDTAFLAKLIFKF